jgi:hypothetical protein
MWTKEIAKRSDIMITSTLSMNLFPKDKRLIDSHFRYEMKAAAVHSFVDERNAFKALLKQHTYQAAKVRDKNKELRENYVKLLLLSQRNKRRLSKLKSLRLRPTLKILTLKLDLLNKKLNLLMRRKDLPLLLKLFLKIKFQAKERIVRAAVAQSKAQC